MRHSTALLILAVAALLEAGGDALVRFGLHTSTSTARALFWVAGALVLFAYAYVVNGPPWDFGRVIGVYVIFFFLAAQVISFVAFHQRPDRFILIGGSLVILGGLVMSAGAR